jgi:hypothetical protein
MLQQRARCIAHRIAWPSREHVVDSSHELLAQGLAERRPAHAERLWVCVHERCQEIGDAAADEDRLCVSGGGLVGGVGGERRTLPRRQRPLRICEQDPVRRRDEVLRNRERRGPAVDQVVQLQRVVEVT